MDKPRNSAMMNMYIVFKTLCQLLFYVAFIGFSFSSVRDFVKVKSFFQIFKEAHQDLKFPDLTFCPRQEKSLAYLKTRELQEGLKLNSSQIASHLIFFHLNSQALEDYSFTLKESILRIRFL